MTLFFYFNVPFPVTVGGLRLLWGGEKFGGWWDLIGERLTFDGGIGHILIDEGGGPPSPAPPP